MPAVAQIMASRSAHTEESEEKGGREGGRDGGRGLEREGKAGDGGRWGLRGEADCMCTERKEDIEKRGKGRSRRR